MPHAAEVHLLVLELLHLDDLGKAGDAFHERVFDRLADPLRESHVLERRQRLVAEEDHQVLQPRRANVLHRRVGHVAQVDVLDLRAERACDALHFHPSHAPSLFRCSCSRRTSTLRTLVLSLSARCAALPAAWPITKHGPDTRAADCPPWVIDAQRPATSRLSTPRGTIMRYGRWL